MESNENENKEKETDEKNYDVEKLIEQKEHLESLFREKFTKLITVMFTDIKGSTSITEAHGDLESRTLIKHHNDILFPIIKKQNGVLIKTMGDGTLSYFDNAQNAVEAAIQIQKKIDEHNVKDKPKIPLLVRIGLHTGNGVVDKYDIHGDVVNVASRYESSANPGEIYFSEDTYNSLTDMSKIYCRFIKNTQFKGKKETYRVYKAFWNEKEIELDKYDSNEDEKEKVTKDGIPLFAKLIVIIIVPVIIAFVLMVAGVIPNPLFSSSTDNDKDKRTIEHSVDITIDEDKE